MATSNSYDWKANRLEIIETALRKVGALGDWESATSEQVSKVAFALNALIKHLQTMGMPVWVIKSLEFDTSDLVTGTVNIGLGQTVDVAKPLKVFQAFLKRDDLERPLAVWDRTNFNSLTNKGIEGTPTLVYYQPMTNYGTLHIYPLPDSDVQANTTTIIHYQAMFEDMDSNTDDLAFPAEWVDAVIYQLAVRIAPEYGLSINERQQLKMEAKEILNEALGFGTEEGSLFIQPG